LFKPSKDAVSLLVHSEKMFLVLLWVTS